MLLVQTPERERERERERGDAGSGVDVIERLISYSLDPLGIICGGIIKFDLFLYIGANLTQRSLM